MKIPDLSHWNNDHRDLVILNVRAKLIGLGHTLGPTESTFLDRKVTCTTCGYMAFLHGPIVASPIIGITCEKAQAELPKVAMMPYGYRQKHSMHDFGYTVDEAGEND